jgi:hypothetical protein
LEPTKVSKLNVTVDCAAFCFIIQSSQVWLLGILHALVMNTL